MRMRLLKRHNGSMSSGLIPLFPLNLVVFPRTRLPLHIFEDRYKEMVGNALRDESEFGIVLAKEDGIVNAGCTVAVEKVLEMYPDGRLDILASGKRRFEIAGLNEEKAYLQGEVNFFDDEDFAPAPEDVRTQALAQYELLNALPNTREHLPPDLADPQLSFQLAQAVSDLDFLSGLLRQRSETSRLKTLTAFLNDYIPKQRAIERMKVLAPTNGFGGKPAGL
jgi:Lon protease-like protein